MFKLSVVIPVYNSEHTISEVVSRIADTVNSLSDCVNGYDIVLVNDCSKDNSLSVCKEICTENDNVRLVSFTKNFGQHHAIMAGYHYVTGDYIVCLDDDLQTPPEEIVPLLKTIIAGDFDVVFGQYEQRKQSLFRNAGSWLNNVMSTYLINKPANIYPSSFFIVKRIIIDEIARYDNPYPYISGLIFRVTQNMGTVTINHNERIIGRSNYSLSKLLQLWLNGFTNFSVKPLRIASLFGALLSIASFLYIVLIIISRFLLPETQLGWASIMVMITFFGGVQLLCVGLLGEYVGRIYLSINKTPQYVIRETINVEKQQKEERVG